MRATSAGSRSASWLVRNAATTRGTPRASQGVCSDWCRHTRGFRRRGCARRTAARWRGGLIELACNDERGRGGPVQPVDDAPAAQCAEDVKLVGPVHGVVDRRFRLHLRDGLDEILWRRNDAAHVASVELVGRRQVLRVGDGTASSWPVSTSWVSGGSWARNSAAAAIQSSIDAGELQIVSDASPEGCRTAISALSMPPQDWPSRWYSLMPSAPRTVWNSSTNSSGVQNSAGASGRCVLLPHPIWS